MAHKKLIIISIDALNAQDFDTLQTLPNFKAFIGQGAYVRHVTSVYPSVTYTCHTSISTGHYPYAHKVYNNEYAQPFQPTTQDWRWFENAIKSPSLFDYASQAGLKVATILWPVMGDADVQWNIPEIWSPNDTASGLSLFWRHGSRKMILPVIRYSHLLNGTQQPELDNFTEAMTLYTLRYKQPDITAIHLTELDTVRHIYGLNSSQALDALHRIDQRLKHILGLTSRLSAFDETNYVLLGDHGTHDFNHVISLNRYLLDHGFMTVDENSHILSWQAYACSCGGSCHIHLSKDLDPLSKDRVYQALLALVNEADTPIEQLLSKKDVMATYALDGDFEWVLEAKDAYVFRNDLLPDLITPREDIPACYIGDHGYRPEHPDMGTLLFMKGPNIRKGAHIDHCSIVDEGPTFAKLMNLTMSKTDGKVLDALIK